MPNKTIENLIAAVAEIKTDLMWLKRSFWVLAGGGVTFNVTLVVGIILFVIKKS